MSIFLDDFNSDAGWSKVGVWVDSTYSISGGENTLTAGTNKDTSAWTRTGFEGRNVSITVRAGASVTGTPQIHLREASSGNYLIAYIDPNDGTLNIGKVVAGTYTSLGSVAISSFSSANTYTFTAKVWENLLFASYLRTQSDGDIGGQIESISSDVNNFTGTGAGIGVTSGTQKYAWIDFRNLETLTNVVCVGDSNVGPDNRLFWPNQMMKRRFTNGFVSRNKGAGGYSTQDVYDDRATKIDPYIVSKADNVLSIATGNNDFVDGLSAAATYVKQQTLMTYAKGLGYRIELATLIPFVYAGDPLAFVTSLNTAIRAGASVDGFTLCEIHNAFGATDGVAGVVPTSLVQADEIHYTTATGQPLATRTHLHVLKRNDRNPVT